MRYCRHCDANPSKGTRYACKCVLLGAPWVLYDSGTEVLRFLYVSQARWDLQSLLREQGVFTSQRVSENMGCSQVGWRQIAGVQQQARGEEMMHRVRPTVAHLASQGFMWTYDESWEISQKWCTVSDGVTDAVKALTESVDRTGAPKHFCHCCPRLCNLGGSKTCFQGGVSHATRCTVVWVAYVLACQGAIQTSAPHDITDR